MGSAVDSVTLGWPDNLFDKYTRSSQMQFFRIIWRSVLSCCCLAPPVLAVLLQPAKQPWAALVLVGCTVAGIFIATFRIVVRLSRLRGHPFTDSQLQRIDAWPKNVGAFGVLVLSFMIDMAIQASLPSLANAALSSGIYLPGMLIFCLRLVRLTSAKDYRPPGMIDALVYGTMATGFTSLLSIYFREQIDVPDTPLPILLLACFMRGFVLPIALYAVARSSHQRHVESRVFYDNLHRLRRSFDGTQAWPIASTCFAHAMKSDRVIVLQRKAFVSSAAAQPQTRQTYQVVGCHLQPTDADITGSSYPSNGTAVEYFAKRRAARHNGTREPHGEKGLNLPTGGSVLYVPVAPTDGEGPNSTNYVIVLHCNSKGAFSSRDLASAEAFAHELADLQNIVQLADRQQAVANVISAAPGFSQGLVGRDTSMSIVGTLCEARAVATVPLSYLLYTPMANGYSCCGAFADVTEDTYDLVRNQLLSWLDSDICVDALHRWSSCVAAVDTLANRAPALGSIARSINAQSICLIPAWDESGAVAIVALSSMSCTGDTLATGLHALVSQIQLELAAAATKFHSAQRTVFAHKFESFASLAHSLQDRYGLRGGLTKGLIAQKLRAAGPSDTVVDDIASFVSEISGVGRLQRLGLQTCETSFNEIAHWLAPNFELQYEFDTGLENDSLVEPEFSRAITKFALEGALNARQHGKATKARLCIAAFDGYCHIVMRDNGIGFDRSLTRGEHPKQHEYGIFGLAATARMLFNAEELDWTNTEYGKGCCWSLKIPISRAVKSENEDRFRQRVKHIRENPMRIPESTSNN